MRTCRVIDKVGFVFAVALVVVLGLTSAAHGQCSTDLTKVVLIDFGNTNTTGGFDTPSPDIFGHYWNTVDFAYAILTNAAGQVTTLAYGSDFITGFDSYNGPASDTNGFTTNPANSNVNPSSLGCLSIDTAVADYIVTCAFEIQGMNPAKKYALNFFGSLKFPDSEITTYTLCSNINYLSGGVVTSVTLNVGSGAINNTNRLAVLSGVSPQSDGIMYIIVTGTNGADPSVSQGILNALSIVDLSTNNVVPPPPVAQTTLLDFGDNNSFRGTNTPSPDAQGHYWNNLGVDSIGSPLVLTNAAGASTGVSFMFDASNPAYTNASSGFGTDSYNGPAGDTTVNGPSACVFNPTALGYLGQTNAVYDYFVSAHFILQNLNPTHQYSLTFFGSHKFSFNPTTVYSVYSDPNYSTLLASTNLLVGAGAAQNQDTVAVISPITPATGSLYVKFIAPDGNLGYLNCMQIVDLTPPSTDAFTTWQTHYFPGGGPNAAPGADPDGDGLINTNEFLAGFNPNNSAAYPHVISIAKANATNLVITYLAASGDNTYSLGFASRTNVLEFTTNATSNYASNNFISTGQTNILSGGNGLGAVASFIQTNGVNGAARYYRVRVLVP